MRALHPVLVACFALASGCGDSSLGVVEITDASIVGRTFEDLQREHRKPARDESLTMQQSGDEFRIHLMNHFDRSSNVELREVWWDEGERYLTVWFQKKDGAWTAFHGRRWDKGVVF